MAEVSMGDTSGCPPTFSLFPPFIPTVIKQCLTASRYAIVKAESTNSPSASRASTISFGTNPGTGDSTPRPSSSGSASTARNIEDSFSDEDLGNINRDVLALGAPGSCEVGSGVQWNRVDVGLYLLRQAGYEAQKPTCESHHVRSLYIDSMAYFLSALPEDLSSEETLTVRRMLPEKLKPAFTPSAGLELSDSTPHSHAIPAGTYPAQRSYLHRLLAASIIYFCILLQYLMPYIKDVLIQLYRYDRAHRVTERVTAATLYVVEKVGRGSVNLGTSVLNMYNGKPGSAVSGAAEWWIEGVAGGIYEGVGEGMAILGIGVGPVGGGKGAGNGAGI
ncbi:uncharacterized protein BDW70DRAFT_155232 [Aspergillus foveolatus]|uniref:uncharacterized protein n=1 Tax=Aspergillus foveolatus TaxID=210207 RepID=UPI003CCDC01D